MKIILKLEPPFEWVRVHGGRVEAFGEVPSLGDYSITEEDDVVGVVSGEWVTTHEVNLPAKTRKQFNAALPYALEEAISEDVDNLHFVCSNWKAGEPCLVHVVAKEKMAEWQALANHYRLPIEQLIPDHALLPFHDVADFSLAVTEKAGQAQTLLAAHREGSSISIDDEFLDVWLMDLPLNSVVAVNDEELTQKLIEAHPDRDFRHWPFGKKLAHWLEYPLATKLDLWSDRFRPSVSFFDKRRLLLPLAILGLGIFIKFSFDTYKYFALHAEIASINQEAKNILAKHFPDLGEVENHKEKQFMQRAIANMSQNASEKGLPFILNDIAPTLKSQNVLVSEFNFRENTLIVTCILNDLSQVDTIARQLDAKPNLNAELQSSETDEGKVIASYKLSQPI